jgi:hypothetical protein
MDLITRVEIEATCDEVFVHLEDLSRYPAWAPLVHSATVSDDNHGDEPGWDVELRAKVGPFARSKRLRMVRVVHDRPRVAEFVRSETDGRQHAQWRLRASVAPAVAGCLVEVHLHYGGSLWGPVLERVLADQVASGREGLRKVVAAGA